MKKCIFFLILSLTPLQSRADLWGGDLPLLAQIVTNTLNTLKELRSQSKLLEDEMAGINDSIHRIRTIAELIKPSDWDRWKNPEEAIRRLKVIYHTMPKKYRNEKSDMVETELSKAMNMIARLQSESKTTFKSGKELERRGKDSSPGVAQKLTASGVGTLISMEAQTQVIQSQITSLLTQMLAEANERESRLVASKGESFGKVSENLSTTDNRFSVQALSLGRKQ